MTIPCGCPEPGECSCVVMSDEFVRVVGDGSEEDPYTVGIDGFYVHVKKNVTQKVPQFTQTALVWDEVISDPRGMWDASQPDRLIVPRDGWYVVTATAEWDERRIDETTGTQWRFIAIDRSSTLFPYGVNFIDKTEQPGIIENVTAEGYFTAGDYVRVVAVQVATGTYRKILGTLNHTTMQMYRAAS